MKVKDIRNYWSRRKRDFRKLFRSLSDFEKRHFEFRRKKLNQQESEMVKIKDSIKADKILYQKVQQLGQSSASLWQKLRSLESRLQKIRDTISKRSRRLEKTRRDYQTELQDYNGMVQVVTNRLKHKPSPEFSVTSARQPEIKPVQGDRRSHEKGLDMWS